MDVSMAMVRLSSRPRLISAKVGDILKSGDKLTKRFGYRRPNLKNNEKASATNSSSKSNSSKDSSSKSSSKKK